jgi:hypothetical protein
LVVDRWFFHLGHEHDLHDRLVLCPHRNHHDLLLVKRFEQV